MYRLVYVVGLGLIALAVFLALDAYDEWVERNVRDNRRHHFE